MAIAEPSYARDLTVAEQQVIATSVKARLRDPGSATFKWGPLTDEIEAGSEGEGTATYCGLVNSRNGYGGYGGDTPFQVFIVLKEGQVALSPIISFGSSKIDKQVTFSSCEAGGYDASYFAGVR
ncbi:MAG: hypothetical protein RLN89_06865 [Parvibaculum sp.]